MKNYFNKNIDIILVLFFIFYYTLILYSKGNDYWLDEMFTYLIKDMSFKETISFLEKDVHPPLYFIFLKIFIDIFGNNFFTFRLFSFIPYILLIITAFFSIRRLFGIKVSRIFILLLILFPVSQYLVTEVRMYSWTLLTVTLSAIYTYNFCIDQKIKYFILSLLFSVGCCYLHNYGVFWVFSSYGIVILYSVISKRWKLLYRMLLLSLFSVLLFLPWLIQLIKQIEAVASDYWIPALDLKTILSTNIYFYINIAFFTGKKWLIIIPFLISLLYFYILIVPVFNTVKNKSKFLIKEKAYSFFILSFLGVLLMSILFSICVKPIYLYRYFTPFLGVIILSISISFSLIKSEFINKIFYISFIFLATLSFYRVYSDNKLYSQKNMIRKELNAFITGKKQYKNIVFLYNDKYPNMFHFYSMYFALNNNSSAVKNIYFSEDTNYDGAFRFKAIKTIEDVFKFKNIFYISSDNQNAEIFLDNRKKLIKGKYNLSDSILIPEINLKGYFFNK